MASSGDGESPVALDHPEVQREADGGCCGPPEQRGAHAGDHPQARGAHRLAALLARLDAVHGVDPDGAQHQQPAGRVRLVGVCGVDHHAVAGVEVVHLGGSATARPERLAEALHDGVVGVLHAPVAVVPAVGLQPPEPGREVDRARPRRPAARTRPGRRSARSATSGPAPASRRAPRSQNTTRMPNTAIRYSEFHFTAHDSPNRIPAATRQGRQQQGPKRPPRSGRSVAEVVGEVVPEPVAVRDERRHRRDGEGGLEDVQQGDAAHHERQAVEGDQ